MADILIKGMEMPKGNDVLIVDSAGTIAKLDTWTGKREAINPLKVNAIELPPHWVLKDVLFWERWVDDKICNKCPKNSIDGCLDCPLNTALGKLYELPTVLEASNGFDN